MNKTYVAVTGAAGSLGSVTAALLSSSGYSVIGIDHAAESSGSNGLALAISGVDLSAADKAMAAFARIKSEIGALHGLVNIAGGFVWESVENGSFETWDRLYRMNVATTLNACRSALPLLLASRGAVVNVSAAATSKADSGMGAYAASKSGVSRLTESLAAEVKGRGVRVNAVLPSVIDTAANRAAMPTADYTKWVKAEDLAQVIRFLISDQSRAVTGALLPVTALT